MTNFTRYIGIKQNEVASKHFKDLLILLQFTKLNIHQNNGCEFTKPQKSTTTYLFKNDNWFIFRDNAFVTFIDQQI